MRNFACSFILSRVLSMTGEIDLAWTARQNITCSLQGFASCIIRNEDNNDTKNRVCIVQG